MRTILDPQAHYVRAGVMLMDLKDAADYRTLEGWSSRATPATLCKFSTRGDMRV